MQENKTNSNGPLWFKDAVIYELHVKAFCDSNNDGIGDFVGLCSKLDYLKDLGVTVIWLLPFYPSPLRDDGYDIADYTDVHPDYGTLRDFKNFMRAAHDRGLRVITELVLNHTSDKHAWFQKARTSKPGSAARDFYVWSDNSRQYAEARIIFQDFETSNWTWDPVARAYFWHRFYSHQPDLNFENPRVRKAMFKVIDFWLNMGVDGLRLDAVPYLYEREGTNCENLEETHAFLRELRSYIDSKYENRMLLAEANQWPEDAVHYFGEGTECHMCFHFPIMPRIYMSLWMEDRYPILDILEQTPEIPENCQWAMFLRNHDELTLEMVSDEERDYMYRVYAKDIRARINLGIRRRLSPLMSNDRRRIELINFILFSFPGTPIIYYGDEIGMGDNYHLGDRDGVRTPMQWSPDRNAGFSKVNPQTLFLPVIIDPEYHYEVVNVENHTKNPSSLLWWMRTIIGIRKRYKAFGRGEMRFCKSDNHKILAFVRTFEDEAILVLVNLSRFSQVIELDLSDYAGYQPVDIISGTRFPRIEEGNYILPLGMHDYFWLKLEPEELAEEPVPCRKLLDVELPRGPRWLDNTEMRHLLEKEILPAYLEQADCFSNRPLSLKDVLIRDWFATDKGTEGGRLLHLKLSYKVGLSQHFMLPLSIARGEEAEQIREQGQAPILANLKESGGKEAGILYHGLWDPAIQHWYLDLAQKKRKPKSAGGGSLTVHLGNGWRSLNPPDVSRFGLVKDVVRNQAIQYEDSLLLKLYRPLESGIHPEAELTAFLTDQMHFPNVPQFAGRLEYKTAWGKSYTIGLLQEYLPGAVDGWSYAQEALKGFFEQVKVLRMEHTPDAWQLALFPDEALELPAPLRLAMGEFTLEALRVLGKRTGELHLAFSSPKTTGEFRPESFTKLYQRSVYQSMRNQLRKAVLSVSKQLKRIPEPVREMARDFVQNETLLLDLLQSVSKTRLSCLKTRIHGDFHLGQVLYTGKDFQFVDFEGESERTIGDRRLKRSCLRDVAGMLLSLQHAAYFALEEQLAHIQPDPELTSWGEAWIMAAWNEFLQAYLETVHGASLAPLDRNAQHILLACFLLERACIGVEREMASGKPDKLLPLHCIRALLDNFPQDN